MKPQQSKRECSAVVKSSGEGMGTPGRTVLVASGDGRQLERDGEEKR